MREREGIYQVRMRVKTCSNKIDDIKGTVNRRAHKENHLALEPRQELRRDRVT